VISSLSIENWRFATDELEVVKNAMDTISIRFWRSMVVAISILKFKIVAGQRSKIQFRIFRRFALKKVLLKAVEPNQRAVCGVREG
jgi:hypothetical protein